MAYSYVTYTSDGVTPAFAIPFPFLDESDVYFYVGNAAYTGTVSWLSTSAVTLSPVPTAGVIITAQRQTSPMPADVVFSGGSLASSDLNLANTQLLYICQELIDSQSRAIQTPIGDPTGSNILAPAAQRLAKVLGFDPTTGLPFPESLSFSVATTSLVVSSTTAAAAATIGGGAQFVLTLGYYTAGDGGGALYYAYGTSAPPDAGSYFRSQDGEYWAIDGSQVLNVRQFGAKADNATDNITSLQNAVNYVRKYGGRLRIPRGPKYLFTGPLVIPMTTEQDYAFILEGDGYDGDTPLPYNVTTGSTLCNISTTQVGIQQHGSALGTNANQDGAITYRDFALVGLGNGTQSGNGFDGLYMNNTRMEGVMVAFHGGCGVYTQHGFSEDYRDCLIFQNYSWGIQFDDTANNAVITHCRVYSNGRNWTTFLQGNIGFTGSAHANQAPVADYNDVSYAGNAPYSVSGGTLTQIVCNGSLATVTAPNHGRSTNDYIAVKHSLVVNLDAVFAQQITVTGANTFTFACSAAAGTYNNSAMIISTASYGMLLQGTTGMALKGFYCEDSPGPAVYVASTNDAFTIQGGFVFNGIILCDGAGTGSVDHVCFEGSGGLYINEANARATVERGLHNVYIESAASETPSLQDGPYFYMQGGLRYGNAIPTTGTWNAGETIWRNSPSAGYYQGYSMGWVCSIAGTPGTWAEMPTFTLQGTDTFSATLPTMTASSIRSVTVTGAQLGMFASGSATEDLLGASINAWVSAANTVKYQLFNPTNATVTLASTTFTLRVS